MFKNLEVAKVSINSRFSMVTVTGIFKKHNGLSLKWSQKSQVAPGLHDLKLFNGLKAFNGLYAFNENNIKWTINCVIRNIIAKIQSQTAIFLFPGGQDSSINSPYVPRMSHITRLLNVRFRLLLHLAAVS